MDEQLIKSILSIKEQAVRSLVRLTESPIEEKFLLEFIKYIERSLMNQSPYDVGPQTEIDGYTYIRKPADDYGITYTDEIIGIRMYHSSSWFVTHSKSLHPKQRQTISTRRKLEKIVVSPNHYLYRQRLCFYPQFIVEVENSSFRLDFAFLLYEDDNKKSEIRRKVGVECDGYEYHSSPTMFKKDRERNRLLQSDDWMILQFSGSELNAGKIDFTLEFDKIFSILGFSGHGIWPNE